jgi:hypothetical protein
MLAARIHEAVKGLDNSSVVLSCHNWVSERIITNIPSSSLAQYGITIKKHVNRYTGSDLLITYQKATHNCNAPTLPISLITVKLDPNARQMFTTEFDELVAAHDRGEL